MDMMRPPPRAPSPRHPVYRVGEGVLVLDYTARPADAPVATRMALGPVR